MRGASDPDGRTAAPGLLRFARNDGQGIGSLVSACRLSRTWRPRVSSLRSPCFLTGPHFALSFIPGRMFLAPVLGDFAPRAEPDPFPRAGMLEKFDQPDRSRRAPDQP